MSHILIDLTAVIGDWLKAAPLIQLLLILMLADLATGISLAVVRRELNSSMNILGVSRKGVTLIIVAVCTLLQDHMPSGVPIGAFVALFYIGGEGISITENAGRLGVKLPPMVEKHFEKLQQEPSSKRAKYDKAA